MREQVPTVTMVTSKPATEQILGEVDVSDTVSPDDAVGAREKGVADHARSAGVANVIDWFALMSEIVWLVPVRLPEE